MNADKTASPLATETCPICRTRYQPVRDRTSPTCGNPNCIRSARDQGLPFASQPIPPEEKPSPVIKKTPGKARKSRS